MHLIRSLAKYNPSNIIAIITREIFQGVLNCFVAINTIATRLAWNALLLLIVIFAWHESHFQYDLYLPDNNGLLIHRLSIIAFLLILSFSWISDYPKILVKMVFGYIGIVIFYGSLNELVFAEGKFIYMLQSAGFSIMMLPIISDRQRLYTLIRLSFFFGMALLALTTVPVLHWLDILSLSSKEVIRYGGEAGLFQFDPLYFGWYGLTENFPYPGHPFDAARLQGFSFEPIHWAYFVFLILTSGLFLIEQVKFSRIRIVYFLAFSLIAIHFFFVYSATAFLTALIWLCIIIIISYIRRRRRLSLKSEAIIGLTLIVIIPGLLVPFTLALIPDIAIILEAEDFLNKGSNWQGKIDFASLGMALYLRILPEFHPLPGASHNLLLSTYVQYGYFFMLPLLVYLWVLIKMAFAGMTIAIMAATTLVILTHTFVVPAQFFWASGSLTILTLVGVAFHANQTKAIGTKTPN